MKRPFVRALVIGAGLLVVGLAGWTFVGNRFEDSFEHYVGEMRARGLPVDSGTRPVPDVPDEENAALPLVAAHEWMARRSEPRPDLPRLFAIVRRAAEATDEERTRAGVTLDAWVGAMRPCLALVRQASSRPALAIGPSGQLFAREETALDPVEAVVAAHTVLEWSIRIRAVRGGSRDALLEDTLALLRLIDLLPMCDLAAWHGRRQLCQAATHDIELIARQGSAGLVRERLEASLAGMEAHEPVLEALDGHRIELVRAVRERARGRGWRAFGRSLSEGGVPSRDAARRAFERPSVFIEGVEALEAIDLWAECFRTDVENSFEPVLEVPDTVSGMKSGLFGEVAWRAFDAIRRHQGLLERIRLTRVGLAVLAHREERGEWPDSLDGLADLFPEGVPRPLDGDGFRYVPGVVLRGPVDRASPIEFRLR